jgi:LPS-assembly protein
MSGRLIAAALASLVSSAAVAAAEGSPAVLLAGPPDQPVAIEADHLDYDLDSRVIRLEGHVVVRRADATLRAERGVLDRKAGQLKLSGNVFGLQGRQVFLADAALVDLAGRSADLTNAVIFLKERPPSESNPRAGKNQVTLHGKRVRRLSPTALEAHDVTLTPCDCPGEPDFEIAADTAVIEGDRAELRGASLVLGGLPIPLFPISLPLTNRQSGMLAPVLGGSTVTGFTLAQPVFVTLGRSLDLTLTPGGYLGGHNSGPSPAALGARNVRGPRLGLETRYAPVEGTRGSVSLDLLYDLDQGGSLGALVPGEPDTGTGRGFGGVRGVGHLSHRSEGAAGTFAVQGTMASDNMVVADVDPLPLDRSLDVLRTDVGAWRASGPLSVGADATLLQDVRAADYLNPDRRLFGPERRHTFQRLPGLFAQVAPTELSGGGVPGVTASAEASVVEFAPFGARDAEERATGFGPTDRGAQSASLAAGPDYGRAPALRLDVAPRLSAALPADLPIELAIDAGARADAWVLQGVAGRDHQRAYLTAGARASVDLERRFGDRLHVITPDLRVRAISAALQGGGPPIGDPSDGGGASYFRSADAAEQGLAPGQQRSDGATSAGVPAARRAYDDLDGAAPSGGAVEATLGLSQSLWTKTGGVPARTLRLDLLQDVLLWSGGGRARFGEASASASIQLGSVSAFAQVRYDWPTRQVSALGAGVSGFRDARGDELHGGLSLLRGSSSERLRAGIDELFSAARLAVAPVSGLTGSASVGASGVLPVMRNGLHLSYDLVRYLLVGANIPQYFEDYDHRVGLAYEPPCHCATVGVSSIFKVKEGKLLGRPDFSLVLDLKSLGSFATF